MTEPCCRVVGPAAVEFDDELGRDGDFWRPARDEAAGPHDDRVSGMSDRISPADPKQQQKHETDEKEGLETATLMMQSNQIIPATHCRPWWTEGERLMSGSSPALQGGVKVEDARCQERQSR
jgi:hypothetical protein